MTDEKKKPHNLQLSDHTTMPVARYRYLTGENSGEAFRDVLDAALKEHNHVVLNMGIGSGVIGIGASWVEECFGGLVRNGWEFRQLKRKLTFRNWTEERVMLAWRFMREEAERQGEEVNQGELICPQQTGEKQPG